MKIKLDWTGIGSLILLIVMVIVSAILLLFMGGCKTVEYKEYGLKKDGKTYVAKEYKSDGMIEWSSGDGKVLNFPLSNPSLINGK